MAEASQNPHSDGTPETTASATPKPAAPLPPGVVLGPDGKPYVDAVLLAMQYVGSCS